MCLRAGLKELDDVDVLLKSGKSSRSLKWLSQARSSINSKDEANGGESPSVLSAPPKPSLRRRFWQRKTASSVSPTESPAKQAAPSRRSVLSREKSIAALDKVATARSILHTIRCAENHPVRSLIAAKLAMQNSRSRLRSRDLSSEYVPMMPGSATEVGAADGAGACAVAGAVAGASASTVEIAAVVSAALRQEIRGLHERIADTVKEVKQIKEMMLADTVNQLKKEVQVAFASSLSTTDGVRSRLSGSTISATDQGTSS